MQNFELNQRELQLQRIIKAQESKISELDGQLSEGSNLERMRLETAIKELTLKFQNKQKEVMQLRDEQNRYKHDLRQSRENLRQSRLHERDSLLTQNKSLTSKVRELEDRIRTDTERNESDFTRVMRINQTLQRQLSASKQNIASIQLEIEKLQIFYRSALTELPKRVDTLQWVDNFIKFMGQYEQNLQRHPFEMGFDKLEKELMEFKKEFGGRVKEFSEGCQFRGQELTKIKEELNSLVTKCLKQCKESLEQNEQFWEGIKKERGSRIADLERKHEEELANCKQQYRKDQQALMTKSKQLEQEKKELTLAFQQLKSYFTAREKSLKEQIQLLKQSNEKLIQMGEKREQSFQSEVAKLSVEVGELSRKYEHNVRVPFEEFNRRFSTDIRNAVNEVASFPYKERCGHLLTRMEGRCRQTENVIRKFSDRQTSSYQTMERHLEHIDSLEKNLQKNIRFIVEAVERYGHDFTESGDFLQEQITYELKANRLEVEELEERKGYEIGLLKRNNSKLQEVNQRLQQLVERQSKQPGNKKDAMDPTAAATALLTVKLEQAEAELQQLRELNNRYQSKFQQDLRKLRFAKYDRQIVNVVAENLSKYEAAVHELRDYCQTVIMPAVMAQNLHTTEYLLDVKASIRETQEFIEQPVKRLKQVVKVQETIKVVPLVDVQSMRTSTEVAPFSNNIKEDIKQYKQLLTEREKASQAANKVLTELVQHLRSTLPHKESVSAKESEELATQRKPKQEGTMQRRIKQLQQARLKDKNQFASALDKLTKAVRRAESFTNRTEHAVDQLGRSQQFLKEKVQYMIGLLEYPLKGKNLSSEFNQVSKKAIIDLESKLKQSVCQNEGLLRQLRLLTNFNQSFREQSKQESQEQTPH